MDEIDEEDCLRLANHLIVACKLPLPEVATLRDIKSCMFSMMFESTFHSPAPDLMLHPETPEEEAHNVQAVIDTISLDILAISLSHITGEDIVSKDIYALYNLLEVFEGIIVYLSDVPVTYSTVGGVQDGEPLEIQDLGTTEPVSRDNSHPLEQPSTTCGICGKGHHSERHVFRDRRHHLKIRNDEDLKSDSDLLLNIYKEDEIFRLSRRKSKSLEQIYIPPEVYEKQETISIGSSGSSREVKRKVRKLADRVNDTGVKTVASTQHEGEAKKPQVSVFVTGRKSRSLEDVSVISLEPVTDQETEVKSESLSSEFERPEEQQRSESHKDGISELEHWTQSLQVKKEALDEQYARNLETKLRLYLEDNEVQRKKAQQTEKNFFKTVKAPVKKTVLSAYRTSTTGIASSRKRGKSQTRPNRLRAPSSSQTSSKSRAPVNVQKQAAFLQELREEFPGVQLTPVTVRRMKQKYEKQLHTMHKNVSEALQRKSRAQLQVEEAAKRQAILSDILRKETTQEQYKKNWNEHKEFQIRVKSAYRDARQKSSRIKNYYSEFHNQMKKRLQQRNTAEEVLLENVFQKGVDIQKEQVRELLKHVKEKQEKDAADQKLYLDALENFYQTQLSMVTESLATEHHDLQERIKAQKRVITTLQRDRRHQMKQEVRKLQDDIIRDNDGLHFRELDAEIYVERLRDKYSTRFRS